MYTKSKKSVISLLVIGGVITVTSAVVLLIGFSWLVDEQVTTEHISVILGLIGLILGIVLLCTALFKLHGIAHDKPVAAISGGSVSALTQTALFAALCYVVFTYLGIHIPVGIGGGTTIHFGNAFCVLAALLLGGVRGGLAGAIGMSLADLTIPAYVTTAPQTFFLKLCIGLITGLMAHYVLHIGRPGQTRQSILKNTIIASACGLVFNIIADPLVGYLYKQYILGMPRSTAQIFALANLATSAINAVISIVVSVALYTALRPILLKMGVPVMVQSCSNVTPQAAPKSNPDSN